MKDCIVYLNIIRTIEDEFPFFTVERLNPK